MTLKLNGSSSGSVSIDAPASTTGGADVTFKLPVADGTSGQVLQTDASGQLSFTGNGGSGRKILEEFYTPCDGSTITTSAGDVTVPNITTWAGIAASDWDDLGGEGSHLTYTPPTGATQVIYTYDFQFSYSDAYPIVNARLLLDGVEVTNARRTLACQSYIQFRANWSWGFNIGGTAVAATGRVANWTSGKTLKWQLRDYNSSYEGQVGVSGHWEGAGSNSFMQPCIGIKAIG